MSAIFISGASAVFTRWYAERDAATFNQRTINKLDSEISFRVSIMLAGLHESSERLANADSITKSGEIRRIFRGLQDPPSPELRGLYPDFSSFPLPALLSELESRLDPDDDEAMAVDRSLQNLANGPPNPNVDEFDAAASQLHIDFPLERWKLFAYTRCTVDDPFCTGHTIGALNHKWVATQYGLAETGSSP